MATKVFVGNLAFATTTETLKKEFGAAGEVINANIISRGPRSLGYGFVELANEAAAQKAVDLLHHKDLDGRVINVEVARTRPEGEERPAGEEHAADGERPRRRRPRKPRDAANGEDTSDATSSTPSTSTKPVGRAPRRRYSQKDQPQGEGQGEEPRRFKKAYRPRGEEGAVATEGSEGAQGGARRGGRGRGRGAPRGTFQPKTRQANGEATQTTEAGPSTSTAAPKARRVRQPRPPVKRQEDRIPSDTTLFVANLPFATTDEQLKALFAKAAPVAAAHVVTRKNGKSKGFGFVEFATKEDQEAGLKAVDGSEVEGRKLNVKVALKAPPTDGAGASGAADDATTAEPTKAAEPKTESKAPEASGEKEKDKVSA